MLFSVASVASTAVLWKVRARFGRVEYGSDMRTAPALLTGLLVILTLVACVPDDEPVRPDPSPTASPIFASDEEALAAAEAAFAAYLQVVDAISADGGMQPERLKEVASNAVFEYELTGFESYQEQGRRTTGVTSFDTVSLQSADSSGLSVSGTVVIYACEDYSDIDVVDSAGNSVVAVDRKTRWPVVVSFDLAPESESQLIVGSLDDWTGEDFCVA